jgi:hypothetical protein
MLEKKMNTYSKLLEQVFGAAVMLVTAVAYVSSTAQIL